MMELINNIWNFFQGATIKIIIIVFIIIFTVLIERIVKRLLHGFFKRSSKRLRVDATQFSFLRHTISAIIYIIGVALIIFYIPQLRALSVSLLAGAGVLAVIVGFASQQAFSNIVSGMFIVIFRPFKVDDRIKIGTDVSGVVEDITLRHTVVRTFENKRIVIPNSVISSEKIENSNLGDEKICKFIEFGISYDSDVKKAKKIMQEEAMNHPNVIDNRSDEDKEKKEPVVPVRVTGFTDSSVVIRAWVWTNDPPSAFRMGCDLNESIKSRFDKDGIEIPFPYRTIVYKNGGKQK